MTRTLGMALGATDYADIFVAAVEGGTNYWAAVRDYRYQFSMWDGTPPDEDYASAVFIEEEDNSEHFLDSRSDEWKKGVAMAAEYFKLSLWGFLEEHDAGYADVAVQFALFGEIVYG